MLNWIDTKAPLPDFVEEAFREALASKRVDGSLIRREIGNCRLLLLELQRKR